MCFDNKLGGMDPGRRPPAPDSTPGPTGDARYAETGIQARVLEEYSGRTIAAALWRKLRRRLFGSPRSLEPAAVYNGLVVFDCPGLHGGGLWAAQRFIRVLMELGLGRCPRLFEFCAGPGYIGYSLLAEGICDTLVLADVNPAAIEAARFTAAFNGIEHLVQIYLSDGLDTIPDGQRWDLVVGNPPNHSPTGPAEDLLGSDPGWNLHRRFYRQIGGFIKPGGHVIMMEDAVASTPETFEPMIREGGGQLTAAPPMTDFRGSRSPFYCVVSRW
ncbi:MAG TPA: methyltransferase [Terriglobales bacterium]